MAIEIFMGFVETDASDGYSLYTQIKHTLTALGIDLINSRAQGNDGASNMRGKLHGFKTRILNEYPKALYSYCWEHNLNLVVKMGVSTFRCRTPLLWLKILPIM